jgi:protein-glutamine gamma-glutamyltransferase
VRLGIAHELGLATAMLVSIFIVLGGGELPAFTWLVLIGPVLSAGLGLTGRSAPPLSATLLGLASVSFAAVTVARGGLDSSVLAGAELLLGLLTARLLVRRTPEHDLQAILLSLLLVLGGSVLNVGINYIFLFVLYAIAVVWALSTRQLLAGTAEGERARVRERTDVVTPGFFAATALISVAVLASAAVVFALFPRVGFGDIGAFLKKESKLPSAVGLRGDPRLAGGTAVIARIKNVPRASFEDGLYLRGAVYDVVTLDGFSQSTQPPQRRGSMVELGEAPVHARYEVTAMPAVGDTLLTLGGVAAARALSGGAQNPNAIVGVAGRSAFDEMKATMPLRSPMRYEVAGGIANPGVVPESSRRKPRPLADEDHARYTAMPPGVDAALLRLAADIVGASDTTAGKATALRRFFLERFRYSLDPPRFSAAPLRAFLLEDRQGHCEFFASGFAVLLRSQGIPARVVGGFQGGAWDEDVVVFQERHAHAWVEWWDEGAGWIVDDATPLATAPREQLSAFAALLDRARRFWDDRVLDYSMQDQMDSLTEARRRWRSIDASFRTLLAGVVLPGVLTFAIVLFLRRRALRRAPGVHPLARAILEAVGRRRQVPVPPSWTLREAVREAVAALEGAGAPEYHQGGDREDQALATALREALDAYERARFGGGRALPEAELRRHRRALRRAGRRARR